ncbi:MAG: hypothetical protein KBC64_05340 [Simkaniaceae bacterium]|nr:hypothetical protein [Simkaniaceae bacterium]
MEITTGRPAPLSVKFSIEDTNPSGEEEFRTEQFTHLPLLDALHPINQDIYAKRPLQSECLSKYFIAIQTSLEPDLINYSVQNGHHLLHLFLQFPLPDSVDEEDPMREYTYKIPLNHSPDILASLLSEWNKIKEIHEPHFSEETQKCHAIGSQLFSRSQHEKDLAFVQSSLVRPGNAKKTLENLVHLAQMPIHSSDSLSPFEVAYQEKWNSHLRKLAETAVDAYEDVCFRVWQTGCHMADGADAKQFIQEHPIPTTEMREAVLIAARGPRFLPIIGSPRPFISQLIGEVTTAPPASRFFNFSQLFHHNATGEQLYNAFCKLPEEDQVKIRERSSMDAEGITHWTVKRAVQELVIEKRASWTES